MGHSVAQPAVRGYRDLLVWRRSVDLVLEIYEATEDFPRREVYGLAAQMEVETQVVIAMRRNYFGSDLERRLLECSAEVGRMLAGLTRSLKRLHRRSKSDT